MVVGFCEQGNERSGSIKNTEFLDQHSDSWFLKDFAPQRWIYKAITLCSCVYN